MASTRDIRRRIKSVKNTAQITKAMQMVAASKMRKAQQSALAGRPYASLMNEVRQHLNIAGGNMGRRRVGADGFVARIGDEQQFDFREGLAGERLVIDAHVEVLAQPLDDLFVSAFGQVTAFPFGVVITAVEQHGFGARLGC